MRRQDRSSRAWRSACGVYCSASIIDALILTKTGRRSIVFATRLIWTKGRSSRISASRFSDRYDELDNAWIHRHSHRRALRQFDAHPCCDAGLSRYGRGGRVPGRCVKPMIEAGKTVVDPTRFVVDPGPAGGDSGTGLSDGAHRAHGGGVFPGRLSCWRRCGPNTRPSTAACSAIRSSASRGLIRALIKPLSLMMLESRRSARADCGRYPFFVSSQAEQAALFGYPAGFEQQIGPSGRWPRTTRPHSPASNSRQRHLASERRRPGIATGGALSSTGIRFRPIHLTCRFAA